MKCEDGAPAWFDNEWKRITVELFEIAVMMAKGNLLTTYYCVYRERERACLAPRF